MNNKLIPITLLMSLGLIACSQPTTTQVPKDEGAAAQQVVDSEPQQALHQFATSLAVNYHTLTNYPQQCTSSGVDGRCFAAQIELIPGVDFDRKDWAIYYSQMRPVKQVLSDAFELTQVKGDLHRITPTDKFKGFYKGQPVDIAFLGELWQLSETDAMPNYYIVVPGLQPEVITSTQLTVDASTGMEQRPYVEAYVSAESQYKRSDTDRLAWATSKVLFDANQDIESRPELAVNAIIPTPKRQIIESQSPVLSLASGYHLDTGSVSKTAVEAALSRLARLGVKPSPQGVALKLEKLTTRLPEGGYRLSITADGITIAASDDAGFSYGLASLTSLISLDNLSLNAMQIQDEPRYGFRGMHVDVARNFHSKQFILDLLDQMAAYKLNKLHLHMADDEGWRLEIDGLPELTQVGSRRCHDLQEDTCLLPQLGSGPYGDSKVNGYYSKADYIEILKYAAARQIQVIPSMDMPGHSRAAIKSMEARYRRLMAEGNEAGANEYRLIDPLDKTQYASIQYYDDNTINVCMESSYHFVDKVVSEIAKLHQAAGQRLDLYHIGADETAGAWVESPVCQALLAVKESGLESEAHFGAYFIERLANMLADKGIETAGWSDGMSHTRPDRMPAKNQSNIWDVVAHGGHKRAHAQANLGWDTVLSNPEVLYFDFPYEADPKEHGYYWASRSTNERKLFSFMPDNLPANAEQWTDIEGKSFEADDTLKLDDAGKRISGPLNQGVRFKGIQGQLWSETIRSDQVVEYMVFPRLLVLAERAWHKADWEVPYQYQGAKYSAETNYFTAEMREKQRIQWQTFANTLGYKELAKLDKAGIAYRVPTVGAKIKDGYLQANSIYPGLGIEYRIDGGQWRQYTEAAKVSGRVEVRGVAADGMRKGRILRVN
ncbi:family 20 glycosylhydrolase [Shewanella sp. Isolate8]|uniref:family 20 glycosylhydrolase n=1 Tax=Shewanella sp. Isolate8 TaxID=2908529 RepID=UPI001EFD0E45|nr:family 20 glycosylhydrolase [Shewanella sp. Isolate8]MCG9745624.1 carbohydate-binding domain-containing protein [Shewanella sp. Isolate8]